MSQPLLLFLLLLPVFFIAVSAQSDKPDYPNCPSQNCGNLTIRYPFWKIDNENSDKLCGYEGFGIRCPILSEPRLPKFSLSGNSYNVQSINYQNHTIRLSAVDPVNDCPRLHNSISVETLPLNFPIQSVNLSFHFDCTRCPAFATEIPCFERNEGKSCVHVMNTSTEENHRDEFSCRQELVTTVLGEPVPLNSGPDFWRDVLELLKSGFELEWRTLEGCEKCEESRGRCGQHNSMGFICLCRDGTTSKGHCKGTSQNFKPKLVIGIVSALVSVVLIFIIYYILKPPSSNCITSLKPKTEDDKNIEAFVMHYGSLSTKRYTYNDIKKMTNSFKVKLGHGGFGHVFKGKLSDGRLVAVKVLNSTKANGQEFINEVASIGRTAHVNIVTLLGFCSDNRKRALVYEYMSNGSLEKFIYSNVHMGKNEHIGVKKLYEIALGIASGLDYLHRGCSTRILHLDIKPHNILLDEDFCPKIADFGLAKLYSRKESIVSMLEVRGTIGYIAPEVYNKNFGGVSHKSDVYSYGMLLLEMVGGRKNVDAGIGSGRTSEIYFPDWIYKRLHKEDFLLDSVTNAEENDYARKMTIVGLWCIQPAPNQRPSINEVIEMLEGSIEVLKVPPKPFFSSPSRSPATIYSTSESISEIR